MKKVLIAAAITLACGTAQAAVTGNNLFSQCTTPSDSAVYGLQQGLCTAYINGVADASPKVCRPEGATYGQTTDIVIAMLARNPQLRHKSGVMLIEFALQEAGWACK